MVAQIGWELETAMITNMGHSIALNQFERESDRILRVGQTANVYYARLNVRTATKLKVDGSESFDIT